MHKFKQFVFPDCSNIYSMICQLLPFRYCRGVLTALYAIWIYNNRKVSACVNSCWRHMAFSKLVQIFTHMWMDVCRSSVDSSHSYGLQFLLCRAYGKRQFTVHLSQQKKMKVFTCLSFIELCPFLRNVVYWECCYIDVLENTVKTVDSKDSKYQKNCSAKINWNWSSAHEYTE